MAVLHGELASNRQFCKKGEEGIWNGEQLESVALLGCCEIIMKRGLHWRFGGGGGGSDSPVVTWKSVVSKHLLSL